MEFLLIIALFIIIASLIFTVITYVFQGLALYKANQLENINPKWIAWVPIINIYSVLKLGEKNTKYIWLFIINFFLTLVLELLEYSVLFVPTIVIMLGISIFTIVITIQAYIKISNKYDMTPVWFIIGTFIGPVMIIAYSIFYTKLNKITKSNNINN